MKYLFTTTNKAFVFCLCLFGFLAENKAQKNTNSPYSRYGVGLLNEAKFNGNFGLGGVGYAWRPYHYRPQIYDSLARSNASLNDRGSNFINPTNPASFSNVSLTTFEASIFSKNTTATSGDQNRTTSNTQLGHMAIAFPVGEKWGVGLGIRPFSNVGYDYQVSANVNGEEVTYQYDGSGGLNEIFVGTATQLHQNLSIGFNFKYLFGTIIDDRRVVYGANASNFFNTYDQRDLKVSDISLEFGLQYFKDLNKDSRLVLGFKAAPLDELNAERSQLIRNYEGNNGFERFKDTALFLNKVDASVAITPTYGIGIAYEVKKKWMVALDYTQRLSDGQASFQGAKFNESSKVNIGFEKFNNASSFESYWKQAGYRLGVNYNSAIVTIDEENIEEFGISFGISLPLRKSFSNLNFGVELGRRGQVEAGLTQEDFINFQFGVTINDKWFIQRKYD